MNTNFSLSQATVIVVRSLRPNWDNPGIEKAIREALDQGNPPPDIVRAIIQAALTPKVKTPRGFLYARELWAVDAPQASVKPPECPDHIGEWAHACRLHAAEEKGRDPSEPAPQQPRNPVPMPDSLRAQLEAHRKTRQPRTHTN